MANTELNKLAQKPARGRIQKFFLNPDGSPQVSRTKQEFKEETQIDNILAGIAKNGLKEHQQMHPRGYVDLPSGIDYHAAQNLIAEGNSCFQSLPAEVRADFDNSPEIFLGFVSDPDNAAQMVEMGLAMPSEATPAAPAPSSDLETEAAPEAASVSPEPIPVVDPPE